ncbi:hypothetical protein [Marinobacter sp. 2_MG-2023]|uniref:hypothetical protein n=1 Tax=Marinobacter sp. 2_MG-2023 TaxID=3062679 RepID=UPI0026E143C4|nr:hypothetical protein [Marinobacter sp. 2_MG-2023]MDO6442789.1 hypothetical protein [Marinobacter sp. 2_MG-2023]
MKFPIVTVSLVSAALMFVLWDQAREQPEVVDAKRFTSLAENPVQLSTAVGWIVTQVPSLCEDATGQPPGTGAYTRCVAQAETRTSTCRRAMYDQFPSIVASEAVFRDLSITLINCLVPDALG